MSTNIETIALLRTVPLLAELSEDLLQQFADGVKTVSLTHGEWVFRQGETPDSAYVIASGRLEVIAEDPSPTVINVLRRGAVVGELGLLRPGAKRAASVRAKRDSELIEVPREYFERFIAESTEFRTSVMRGMADLIALSRVVTPKLEPHKTLTVVGLDPAAPVDEVAARLTSELQAFGQVTRLEPSDGTFIDWIHQLSRAEEDRDWVVLTAGGSAEAPHDNGWTSFCLKESDLTIAVTTLQEDMSRLGRDLPDIEGCHLLIVGGRYRESLAALTPKDVRVVSDIDDAWNEVALIARRVAGRSVGLVLSGGAAKGLAHIGVVEELLRAGIKVDRIGGASIGALLGGFFAKGLNPEEVSEVCR